MGGAFKHGRVVWGVFEGRRAVKVAFEREGRYRAHSSVGGRWGTSSSRKRARLSVGVAVECLSVGCGRVVGARSKAGG